jgi:hypothetical protein
VVPLDLDNVFVYPTGQLAAIDKDKYLWFFANEHWQRAQPEQLGHRMGRTLMPYRSGYIVLVDRSAKPWLSTNDLIPMLVEFPPEQPARYSDILTGAILNNSEFYAAISWDATHLLLALSSGLCVYDLVSGGCPPLPAAHPSGIVSQLARDATGRVWMGGRGLWSLDRQGRAAQYDESLPFLRDTLVTGLGAVGGRLVLALGSRGIAIVRP